MYIRHPVSRASVPHAKSVALVSFAHRHGLALNEAYQLATDLKTRIQKGDKIDDAFGMLAADLDLMSKGYRTEKKLHVRQQIKVASDWLSNANAAMLELVSPCKGPKTPVGAEKKRT